MQAAWEEVSHDIRVATGEAVGGVIEDALDSTDAEPETVRAMWRKMLGVVGRVHWDPHVSAHYKVAFRYRLYRGVCCACICCCRVAAVSAPPCAGITGVYSTMVEALRHLKILSLGFNYRFTCLLRWTRYLFGSSISH